MSGNKKEQILHAVLETIGKGQDPLALPISDIAASAGIGKGTVYEYFASKDDMVREAYVLAVKRILDTLEEPLRGEGDTKERTLALINCVFHQCDINFAMISAMFESQSKIGFSQSFIEKNVFPLMMSFRDVFLSHLERAAEEGEIRVSASKLDCDIAMMMLFNTALHIKRFGSIYKEKIPEDAAEYTYNLFIKILA